MATTVNLYNPRRESHATLEKLLVGRGALVDEIMDDLRRQAHSPERRHWLLRGPRGSGKTHLTAIVYHRVRADPLLARAFIPVWLPEAETYAAYSAAELLRQVAEQLQLELREQRGARGTELQQALARALDAADPFPALEDALAEEARRRGAVLLVLMENLDALLHGFMRQKGEIEARRLRGLLSGEEAFCFLSTTPTRYLRRLDHPDEPLFQHLKERHLAPLDEEDVGRLLRRLGEVYGTPAGGAREPDGLRRRIFHRLTGGNPRSIAMAFQALSGAQGVAAIVAELEHLLDNQTAYFEARLSGLAPRERAIVTAMALAPTNLTLDQIARLTRLPARSLSTQLTRLADEGWTAPVGSEGGKGALHELTDGLFRLWWQYRRGNATLEPLVRFLALWYEPEELRRAADALRAGSLAGFASETAWRSTLGHLESALAYGVSEEGRAERAALRAQAEAELAQAQPGEAARPELPEPLRTQVEQALAAADAQPALDALAELERAAGSLPAEALAYATVRISSSLCEKGRLAEALRGCDFTIKLCNPPQATRLHEVLAGAFLVRDAAMQQLGRFDEALAASALVVDRFGSSDSALLRAAVTIAWVNRAVVLEALNRHAEALAAYAAVIDRLDEVKFIKLQESVARGIVRTGASLTAAERYEEALAAYDSVVERFAGSDTPALQEQVARALVNRGAALGGLGRTEEALAAYDSVVERFGGSESPALQQQVARALVNRGVALGQLGRSAEALAAYDNVVERFGSSESPALQQQVARALVIRGAALGGLGRTEEALAAYDSVVERFGSSDLPALQEAIVAGLVNRGSALQSAGRLDEARTALRDAVARAGRLAPAEGQPWVVRARTVLAASLDASRERDEAEVALDAWIAAASEPHGRSELLPTARLLLTQLDAGLLESARNRLRRLEHAEDRELAKPARWLGFLADVVTATEAPRKQERTKPGSARRRALAQVPPELRQSIDEAAREIVKSRRQSAKGSAKTTG